MQYGSMPAALLYTVGSIRLKVRRQDITSIIAKGLYSKMTTSHNRQRGSYFIIQPSLLNLQSIGNYIDIRNNITTHQCFKFGSKTSS